MNWWYWTWVLYSATIVAILRGLYSSDAPLRAYGDGIARSRRRKRLQSPRRGPASPAGMSMPPPEGFWRTTASTNILCTAPDMGSAWKCTRSPGWHADRSMFWFPEMSLRSNLEFTCLASEEFALKTTWWCMRIERKCLLRFRGTLLRFEQA